MAVSEAVIITVANQKGGVGKTTTTMNLGVALAQAGKRVLLVDSDPQANLTSYLGVSPGHEPHEGLRTLDELYLAKRPVDAQSAAGFIASTESGVDLIASDQNLGGVEYYLFSRSEKELVLSHFLKLINTRYDYIFIDTPPSLNLLTLNALCASNHVLVPVQTEFFSLEGIVKIQESIENVKGRFNPGLSIIGVLPTQVAARRKLTGEVIDTLRSAMGELIFTHCIRDNAAVTESSGNAQSVIEYDRSSNGAKDYLAAAQELAERLSLAHPTSAARNLAGAAHAPAEAIS